KELLLPSPAFWGSVRAQADAVCAFPLGIRRKSMIRKSQLFLAVAALAGMNVAMAACNTTQWGQGTPPGGAVVGAPIADGPVNSDANPAATNRYSGKCSLGSTAAGNYVQDGLP